MTTAALSLIGPNSDKAQKVIKHVKEILVRQ